jgi:FKBP-type peptidyl-prolyl cis-trans isomerase
MKKRTIVWILSLIIILSIVIFYIVVNQKDNRVYLNDNLKKTNPKENLENINKFLVEKDKERIKSFVERRKWDMKTTESGLWYMVYEQGDGRSIQYGDYVKINYEIRLLDGTLLYSSEESNTKNVHVGRDEEVKGLHEGLEYLNDGDKARFIIPPHLAHGLIGDGERIPARSILYYDIQILEVSENKIQ